MNNLKKQFVWLPRILGILFVLFTGLFAMDVFEQDASIGATLLAFLLHLLPSFALAIGVGLAWRWEWVGAVSFLGFAGWYVLFARGFPWDVYAIMAGIPAVIGLCFALSWMFNRKL